MLWEGYRQRAAKKGVNLGISYEELLEMFKPMRCSVTGVDLNWDFKGRERNPWAPSLDRRDNSKGYTRDNVRVVCLAYNIARSTWSDEVVKHWVDSMLKSGPSDETTACARS